jgi:hypothetical protein
VTEPRKHADPTPVFIAFFSLVFHNGSIAFSPGACLSLIAHNGNERPLALTRCSTDVVNTNYDPPAGPAGGLSAMAMFQQLSAQMWGAALPAR